MKTMDMERYNIFTKSDKEIVFSSVEDLMKFWDAVNAGKWVIVEYITGKTKHGELIYPDISAEVKEKKITIRSERKI